MSRKRTRDQAMSDESKPRLVWYLLLDSTNGQPYKGTGADKVSVSSSADVADFRKAVLAENTSILTGIVPSQLLVYKNKDAFNNRNAVDTENKGEPLKSSLILESLGGSEEESLIVAVPSISSSEGDTSSATSRRVKQKQNFLQTLRKDIQSPSSFSQLRNPVWPQVLINHKDKLICHRFQSEEFSAPVCLLNPIFNNFVYDLNHINISSEDCVFVSNLITSMCGYFATEDKRKTEFIHLFGAYMKSNLVSVSFQGLKTDGSYFTNDKNIFCNLEVKVEKGSGNSEAFLQNIAYYVKQLPDNPALQYPCFLLELCGAHFSVSGILTTDTQIICEPLSPTYPLLCNQNFIMTGQITKLFASLRKGLIALRSQYSDRSLLPATSFPCVSTFEDPNSNNAAKFMIEYQQKIKGFVFSAKVLNSEREVIVKFCSRYNETVHRYCHSCGFAPALISHMTYGHYIVVVMEKLVLRELNKNDISDPDIQQQIKDILTQLKMKHFVHGDLRECNILFDADANKVVLVDFDWSGTEGKEVYPPFMNPVIEWPDGASTGKQLCHDHDVCWIRRLLNVKWT